MNPIAVQSANLTQFGFSTTFKLADSVALLSIDPYTVFTAGGAANVVGVCFEIQDPSGSFLSSIDFSNPAIVPSTGILTYQVSLTSSASQFGWYSIIGVLRDQNGQDYKITLTKNICKPAGQISGTVPGILAESVDCTVPKVQISDNTNLTYLNQMPIAVVKTGMFYYPAGTINAVPFSYTPFQVIGSGNVYTGGYTVRLKTLATYDLSDLVFVQVTYASSLQFNVTCNSTLCQVLCCVEEMQAVVDSCGTVQANNAKEKLAKATIPLIMALTLEKCGQDSSEAVKEVSDILGCNCNCDAELVEARPIYTSFTPTVLQGQCGTTAVLEGGVWNIKSRTISIVSATPSDQSFVITSAQTDCNVAWTIAINKYLLTGDILNIIKNDSAYLALLNSLIQQSSIDYSGIGPNCVIDLASANYSLVTDASDATKTVLNIVIGGTVYNAPGALSVTNAAGIATWLNSLNKGIFTVNYDAGSAKTTILSNNNIQQISTISFTLSGGIITQQFSKNGATTFKVIQAIIGYLCGLTENKIALSSSYTICTLKADGTIEQTQITPGAGVTTGTLMTKLAQAFCTSLQNVKSIAQVDCEAIKTLFNSTQPLTQNDVIYGTRSDTCGPLTVEDIARQYLTYMLTTNKADLLELLCQVNRRCVIPVCNPVQFMSIEMIEPCPGVTNIIGTITNS